MDWRTVNEGPKWVPVILDIEGGMKIPAGLLARMAFQESSFLAEVIAGTHASKVGALGILQLMPEFFSVVRSPIPFNDFDTKAQITTAGQYLVSLHNHFQDWGEALAAYNYGPGNESKYLEHKISGLPTETTNYVAQILADIPGAKA